MTKYSDNIKIDDNLEEDTLDYKTHDDMNLLKEYLEKILVIHQAQFTIAQTKWDTGVTATMNWGNSDMIDFYEEVLIELSTFYPKGHFNNQNPKSYFNEMVSSRFLWYRLILEPEGGGTGGTIISTLTGGSVMEDLKQMIVDMVTSLFMFDVKEQFNIQKWKEDWLKLEGITDNT